LGCYWPSLCSFIDLQTSNTFAQLETNLTQAYTAHNYKIIIKMNSLMLCFSVFFFVNSISAGPIKRCITSCRDANNKNLKNGEYQSCKSCNVYASCWDGAIMDNRPCHPATLVWDDNVKRCEWVSDTCPEKGPSPPKPTTPKPSPPKPTTPKPSPPKPTTPKPSPPKPTTPKPSPSKPTTSEPIPPVNPTSPSGNDCETCIKNCAGKPDEKQKYKSCTGCNNYAECENGKFTDNISCCTEGEICCKRQYDDNLKRCLEDGEQSSTCS